MRPKMHRLLTLIPILLLSGCSTLPEQYAATPTRSLVKGRSNILTSSEVQIRSVDDGDVIWVNSYHLGNKVWLEPGSHKISVACTSHYTWGSYMVCTDVTIDVQTGYTYFLSTPQITSPTDKPVITVTKKKNSP